MLGNARLGPQRGSQIGQPGAGGIEQRRLGIAAHRLCHDGCHGLGRITPIGPPQRPFGTAHHRHAPGQPHHIEQFPRPRRSLVGLMPVIRLGILGRMQVRPDDQPHIGRRAAQRMGQREQPIGIARQVIVDDHPHARRRIGQDIFGAGHKREHRQGGEAQQGGAA